LKGAVDILSFLSHIALRIVQRNPKLVELTRSIARRVSPDSVVVLDYPVNSKRRWDEKNPHPKLNEIINRNRASYKSTLQSFLALSEAMSAIPAQPTADHAATDPSWINGWMPAFDGVAIYGFIAMHRPGLYLEVGSGNSTKFARKAIGDHNLDTKIVSIDPYPRAEIDSICDEIIRKPVENVDPSLFDRLEANDILYIDNSHRALMNSDATMLFLDVLPRLKPGVIVEIHDVTLPYDYPTTWIDRFYSEQYVLAAYILAQGKMFDIIMPSMFISYDKELKPILAPFWNRPAMKDVQTHGCSFWIRMK
jgi:hypothetical protein